MNKNIWIVQNTWTEQDDQDLHDYLKASNIAYIMLDIESIKNKNPKDIGMLFCDTEIMQDLLKKYNVYIEIETYPDFFSKFYNRNIIKLKPKELLDSIKFPFPYFIKPIDNDKTFDGTLIKSEIVRNYIFTQIPDHNKLIYYCTACFNYTTVHFFCRPLFSEALVGFCFINSIEVSFSFVIKYLGLFLVLKYSSIIFNIFIDPL